MMVKQATMGMRAHTPLATMSLTAEQQMRIPSILLRDRIGHLQIRLRCRPSARSRRFDPEVWCIPLETGGLLK